MESKLRIGSVPEHFSSPLHIGVERGLFKKHLVDVELRSCPGGTGEMVKLLESKELDVAIALTEGLVSSIAKGCDALKIVGTFVGAPLCWAISSAGASGQRRFADLDAMLSAAGKPADQKPVIGVSRFGSGSHIMAFVLAEKAQQRQMSTEEDEAEPFGFKVLSDFKGLRDGVNNGVADAFLWERFTTKPYHDSKEVSYIGSITPPWPAFMIAVRTEVLQRDEEIIHRLLAAFNDSSALFTGPLLDNGEAIEYVARTQKQQVEDVKAWFKTVSYPRDAATVSASVLSKCVSVLKEAGALPKTVSVQNDQLCDLKIAKLIE